MKTIFLDIDGVISTQDSGWTIVPELLKRVTDLAQRTDASIVISSSWKEKTFRKTLAFLPPELARRTKGQTPTRPDGNRQLEIKAYLQRHPTESYAILDDNLEQFRYGEYELFEHLVLTNAKEGITEADAEAAERLLATKRIPKILYRSESYSGSGVRDIREVIEYEMASLGNRDIPEYVLNHYSLPRKVRKELKATLKLRDEYPFLLDRSSLRDLIDDMVSAIGKQLGKDIKYGLWLAEEYVVREFYTKSNYSFPDAYPTSDVILSDLDEDGILFAYEEIPEKNKTNHHEKDNVL